MKLKFYPYDHKLKIIADRIRRLKKEYKLECTIAQEYIKVYSRESMTLYGKYKLVKQAYKNAHIIQLKLKKYQLLYRYLHNAQCKLKGIPYKSIEKFTNFENQIYTHWLAEFEIKIGSYLGENIVIHGPKLNLIPYLLNLFIYLDKIKD